MNPVAMAVIIVSLTTVFAVSAWRRFNLLKVGTATWESRLQDIPKRLGLVWTFAFFQKKMRYYWLAGVAHQFIFLGFVVLLLRTLVLWGRGFSPSFNLFVLGPDPVLGVPLGAVYGFLKDIFASLVLLGVAVFVYFRVVRPQKRMTLGVEGLVILGIIATMMLADLGATVIKIEHPSEPDYVRDFPPHVAGGGSAYFAQYNRHKLGASLVPAVRNVTLAIAPGEFVALKGPSGSGKTTLLNLLGLLDRPDAGVIRVEGRDGEALSEDERSDMRRDRFGFVFQTFNLIPVLTAFQNVELPLLLTKLSKSERRKHVETALGVVGLSERMNHYPRQLSGGQEQRVAIARAIVADPTFLLCDEPTGDLDRKSADEIMSLIIRLVKEFGKTVLMVTHDPVVAKLADLELHLEKGLLVEGSQVQQNAYVGGAA